MIPGSRRRDVLGRLRDADRRAARRAWTRVRCPAWPAWIWFVVDVWAGGLAVLVVGALVGLASEEAGQVVGLIGFFGVITFAVVNFVRMTGSRDVNDATP